MCRIKVLYVGDSGIVFGPIIFESPFIIEVKDAYYRNWAKYFIDLVADENIEITHIDSIRAYREFPRDYMELKKYDVIILSDVSSEIIRFYPEFFPIEEVSEKRFIETKDYVGMPDRLNLIKRFVLEGGGLIMAGGWYSFSGRFGQGAWYRTPIEEVLPVRIMEVDDRIETPSGAYIKVLDLEHPITRGIPWETSPPLLGYNKVEAKENAKTIAIINEKDPLIVVWEYGRGRTMAFTSDLVLHWGINFIKWKHYKRFWTQTLKWICRKD